MGYDSIRSTMTYNPSIRLIRKPSRKDRQKKVKRLCINCLNSYSTFESRNTGFRADYIHCSLWKTVVHITHAKICPHFPGRSRARRRGRGK